MALIFNKMENLIVDDDYNFDKIFNHTKDFSRLGLDDRDGIFEYIRHLVIEARIQLGYTEKYPVYQRHENVTIYPEFDELLITFKIIITKIAASDQIANKITIGFGNDKMFGTINYHIYNGNFLCTVSWITKDSVNVGIKATDFEDKLFVGVATGCKYTVTDEYHRFYNTFNKPLTFPITENVEDERAKYLLITKVLKLVDLKADEEQYVNLIEKLLEN